MTTRKHRYPTVRKNTKRATNQVVSEARVQTFLKVLRETGVPRMAARAASPHALTDCINSFRDHAGRDPAFRAAWDEAQEEADARLEHEAYRRAVVGVREGVFQKGRQAVDADGKPAFVHRFSDNLLLRLLEKRDPDSWAQHRKINHSGSTVPAGAVAAIALSDINYLSDEQRRQLAGILRTIQGRRGDDSEVVVDADWAEVDEGDEPPGDQTGEPLELPAPVEEPMAMLSESERVELEEICS